MLCPWCHTENRGNAKFCKGCGHTLPIEAMAPGQPVSSEQQSEAEQAQSPSAPPAPLQSSEAVANSANAGGQQASEAPSIADAGASVSEQVDANQDEDISHMPTQILTQQQMLAFHKRRWEQQEQEREGYAPGGDIADSPTILMPLINQQAASDIADYPTISAPPLNEGNVSAAVPPSTATEPARDKDALAPVPAPAPQLVSIVHEDKNAAAEVAAGETRSETTVEEGVGNEPSMHTNNVGEAANNEEESSVGQKIDPNGGKESAGATGGFPVLAQGALVGGRYEVTQVISDASEEHIYEVTDHQGWQHCWNCGSEENAEGDEFCNNCGAGLLNATYLMHEYPPAEKPGEDARVLQGSIVNTIVDQSHTYVIEQPQTAQVDFPNGVHLIASSDSDAGTVRRGEVNEDSTLVLFLERVHESLSSPAGLFIVADGMGGHANGQGASRMTIGLIAERFVRELLMPPLSAEKSGESQTNLDEEGLLGLLQGAIEDANTALCQINQRDKTDMGSTLTGFMVVGEHAYIFNVGDSRTYMLRDEKLYQLTNDHSLVGQLVAGGLIEPEDVYTHPQRNQIFRSIGDKLNVQIDLFKQQVHPGDILISCSDGLWEMARDPQIGEILSHAPDPQTACAQLIEAANANGGEDNVSAVVVFVR